MPGTFKVLVFLSSASAFHLSPRAPRALCNSHASYRVRNVSAKDRIDDFIQSRWEKLIGHDAADRIAEVAGNEEREEAMIAARDAKLAERDTKKWCVDRCLATGYCDAV